MVEKKLRNIYVLLLKYPLIPESSIISDVVNEEGLTPAQFHDKIGEELEKRMDEEIESAGLTDQVNPAVRIPLSASNRVIILPEDNYQNVVKPINFATVGLFISPKNNIAFVRDDDPHKLNKTGGKLLDIFTKIISHTGADINYEIIDLESAVLRLTR